MARMAFLYTAIYTATPPLTGCTTIYHFMTTNDSLETLQEPALMQESQSLFRALYIVSMVAEDAQVQVKCFVLLSRLAIVVLFMWCSGNNTSLSKNCAATLVHICQALSCTLSC